MDSPSTRRRPLLLAVVGGAAAVGTIGAAARSGLLSDVGANDRSSASGRLRLSSGGAGVRSLDVVLDDTVLRPDGRRRWHTAPMATTTYSMIGFTWRRGEAEPLVEISARVDGTWRQWQRVAHVHDAPDPGEDSGTVGTELALLGRADGIRLRVSGHRPAELTMALLHPTALPGDRAAAAEDTDELSGRVVARGEPVEGLVPRPEIRSRREWGADEGWRTSDPRYNETIKQVHIHHTVNSNDYSRADVPALIRGMYRYHTHNLGWSDLGYNFLVDRFGRIWVGRAGGARRPVRGAHTLGFNATSTGISVIGNYDLATPNRATLAAIARLAAWKLDKYGRDPRGRTSVRSEGSDKYPSGMVVRLPVIDGHRDTNDTACPGQRLYDALPAIRRRTQRRMDRFGD